MLEEGQNITLIESKRLRIGAKSFGEECIIHNIVGLK